MLGYPLLLYDTVPSKMLNSPTFVALLSKAKVYKSQVIPGLVVVVAQHDVAAGDV